MRAGSAHVLLASGVLQEAPARPLGQAAEAGIHTFGDAGSFLEETSPPRGRFRQYQDGL